MWYDPDAMRHLNLFLLLLIFSILLTGCGGLPAAPHRPPQAVDGILDLRAWDFATDGPVTLGGVWEFYWRRLPTSQELAGPSPPSPSGLIPVPGTWNKQRVDGQPVGASGYATYRLRVRVDPATMGDGPVAIRMPPPMNTAHILYVNGQQVGGAGQVGKTPESTRAAYAPYIAVFPLPDEQMELLIHISNYEHAAGGILEAPVFGPYLQVLDQFQLQAGRNLFLVGAIVMMGLYHLILFSLRRRERAYLYFGLLCLAVGATLIAFLYPAIFARTVNQEWSALPRVGISLGALVALLLMAFTDALFPQESFVRWRILLTAPALLTLLLAGTVPVQTVTWLFTPFAFYWIAAILFSLVIVLQAVRQRQAGAKIVLLGYLPLMAALVNDGLFFTGQWRSESLLAVGLTLYVLAHAYLLSMRFARAFTQAEDLSEELQRNNAALLQAQGALRRSEAQHRSIFVDSTDLIFTANLDHGIEAINPACFDLLGFGPDELTGKHVGCLFADDRTSQRLWEALESRGTLVGFAVELHHPSGRNIPCTLTASLRRDEESGAILGYQAIVHDMTDYRRAEKEREQVGQLRQQKAAVEAVSQAKSNFLATMTHELRTPLNSILGYAQILRQQFPLSPDQSRAATAILSSGYYLLHLIEDVLDLARIEANRLRIMENEVDLPGLLVDVFASMRMEAEQKGLRLTEKFAANLPAHVVTDEKRLRQILLNLLSNAIRYTQQGQVSLTVSVLPAEKGERAWLRFAVTDTGLGLSDEELQRIFAPFEQVAPANSANQGLGLGLAVSQELARRLGRGIHVESTPGAGSRFWFDIPCVSWDEWKEGEVEKTTPVVDSFPAQDRATLALSPEDLQPLYELTQLGDIKGVEAEAKRLAAANPACQPFVDQVLILAQGFNDQGIRDLIEGLSND